MKKILIIACAASAMLLGGCNSKLDNMRPHNQLDEATYLQSVANITNATSGAYALIHANSGFSVPANYYYSYYCMSEFTGNNVIFAETFSARDGLPPMDAHFHLGSYGLQDSYAGSVWVKTNQIMLYTTKNILAIDRLLADPLTTPQTEATLLRLRGENYFLRGFMASNAMNVFARPYWDNPTENLGIPFDLSGDGVLVPRSTVVQSYSFIIEDFKRAAADLPEERTNRTYANRPAAYAYLSRLYLNMGGTPDQPNSEYNDLAAKYADSVFMSTVDVVALEQGDGYRDMFENPSTSTELLFSFWTMNMSSTMSTMLNALYNWSGYESTATTAIQPCVVSEDYIALVDSTRDLRWEYFIQPSVKHSYRYTMNKLSRIRFIVFGDYYGFGAATPYMRAAEVVLNRAEAYAKMNNTAAAITDLNSIRTRAGLDPVGGLSGTQLFDAIFAERRRELAFEGLTYYDYVRNGITMSRTETTTVYDDYVGSRYNEVNPVASRRTMWPIPQEEIDLNDQLIQNQY